VGRAVLDGKLNGSALALGWLGLEDSEFPLLGNGKDLGCLALASGMALAQIPVDLNSHDATADPVRRR
jgi:hypothetical protein